MPRMSLFRTSSSRSLKGVDGDRGEKETRKERVEEARTGHDQNTSRRRNFRFLRSLDAKKRTSTATMKKTRDHARQLAMAYDEPPTPTESSTSSIRQNLLSMQDASTPSPAKRKENNFFDPFGNGDPFQQQQQQQQASSLLDQHFAKGRDKASREPTASTLDSFDTSSMGSGFFPEPQRGTVSMPTSSNTGSVNDLARRRYNDDDSQFSAASPVPGRIRMRRVPSSAGSVAGSVYSQASYASQASTNSSSNGNTNFFDTGGNGGFTFDAFGLDESKVQNDVDAAMQALAGDGIRGFSFMQQDSDGESEFAPQNWDSPNTSRNSAAPEDLEGFVDGFRPEPRSASRTRNITGSTPPRWEKPQQRHQHSKGGRAGFDNPWTHDPFAGETSASEVGSNSDFGGTKSEFLTSSSQASIPNAPFSGNKSDHGGISTGFRGVSLEKLQSPSQSIFRKNHSGRQEQRVYNKTESEDSHDGIQEDLAREFAQDFVKRISPKHAGNQPPNDFGSPRSYRQQSTYDDDDDRSVSSRKSVPIDLDTCEEWSDDGRSVTSDTSRRSCPIDLDTNDEWEDDGQSVTSSNSNYRPRSAPAMTPKSQFRSFRDRYDSSKETESKTTSVQSYRARAAQQSQEEDTERRTSYGSLRSSYAAAKATTGTPKYSRTSEEKKDDEDLSSAGPKRGNLKAKWQKWEAKTKPVTTSPSRPPRSPVPAPKQEIVLDDSDGMSIEIMTAESAESLSETGAYDTGRRSSINKDAFSRLREKSEPSRAPSFTNVTLRKTVTKAQLEELMPDDDEYDEEPQPSRPLSYRQQHAAAEPTSPQRSLSYRERRELELKREAEEKAKGDEEAQRQDSPKKLTYRERRELELQREAEEKAKTESSRQQGAAKPDVAALVRKRIAANKKKADEQANAPDQPTTNFRDNLKPVKQQPVASPTRGEPARSSDSSNSPTTLSSPSRIQQGPEGNLLDQATVDALQSENAELQAKVAALEKAVAQKESAASVVQGSDSDKPVDPKAMLGNFLGAKLGIPPPAPKPKAATEDADKPVDPKAMLGNFLGAKLGMPPAGPPGASKAKKDPSGKPALKDDPKYEKYFRMMKVGMPKEQVKHALQRDGLDPSVLDGDPNKPAAVGLPLKEDPTYTKYFKMLKVGIPMSQVKQSMAMDGLVPEVMDQDHNLPASSAIKLAKKKAPKQKKDTHRRARLHWKSVKNVVNKGSIWGKIDQDESMSCIGFDEDEFKDLFQAELGKMETPKASSNQKKGVAVRVIDSKRANNGGIILARIKLSHDDMADAVDRMDSSVFTAGQVESFIEYLPTSEERQNLEKYMVEGGKDAAQKFNGLCECEKFMVSMMTVKHAKRKVNALLFKLQFDSCLESITADADLIDSACEEAKNSSRLRQLLGIVLQFGNRLNTAGSGSQDKVGSFTLDSLLKLKEAKAFDKKTTFLQYIVLIVQRNNENLLNFVEDLPTVLRADRVYWDQCLSDLEDVESQLENVRKIAIHEAKNKTVYRLKKKKNGASDDDSINEDVDMTLEEEVTALRSTQTGLFTLSAIKQVSTLRDKVDKTMGKYKKLLEYFGEDEGNKQPQELFAIFVKFSRDFDKAKEVIFRKMKKKQREEAKKQKAESEKGKPGKPPMSGNKPFKTSNHQSNVGGVVKDLKKDFMPSQRAESKAADKPSKSKTVKSWPTVNTVKPIRNVYSDAATDGRDESQTLSPSRQSKPLSPSRLSKPTSPRQSKVATAPTPSPKDSAKQSFRDSARQRRLREMQDKRRASYTPTKPAASPNTASKTSPEKSRRASSYHTPTTPAASPYSSSKTSPEKRASSPVKSSTPKSVSSSTAASKPPSIGGNGTPASLNSRNVMRNRRRLMEARKQRSTPSDTSSPWKSPNVPAR